MNRNWRTMAAVALVGGLTVAAGSPPLASPHVDLDAEPTAPTVPQSAASGDQAVKDYLLTVIASARSGAADLKSTAAEYTKLVAAHGNDPVAAAKAEPATMAKLIRRARNEYKRIDSYGYEYMEGIVAGIPTLIHYDVELDSGVPAQGAGVQDAIAEIRIVAGDTTIDHDGSLNNYLIEPTVYGTNVKFVAGHADLPGLGNNVGLPKPAVLAALADYAVEAYGRLDVDARAWQPTDRSLFQAMANMTPTLSGYFDDWKQSKKYGGASGGRFVAVSRVSDMRGIMSSTQLNWLSMKPKVEAKDKALADQITDGYTKVMRFIDTIDARDQRRPLQIQTIDALGTQAKDRADKLTVQVSQAAAELGLDVNGK